MLSTVYVPPDPKYTAEVVVLLTTLGAKRVEYNAGKRVRDLLEIKRVHYKVVDFNRDGRVALDEGEDIANRAIHMLGSSNRLHTGGDGDITLPQIYVDGQYIGDATDLQYLEDEGRLEGALIRRQCIACGQSREVDTKQCRGCWIQFEEVLPGLLTVEEALKKLSREPEYYDEDDDDYDEEEEEEWDD
eukprot:TRINITY_DN64848_c0_g1_i1.p1 TRINITY_DN64848_c0_g1~~TRINITY_DN64848_c0_g1_i1.p1  ORF type:complete len:188 (-),score=43.19 TRINITY_DN64848_c0_g1_i1:45-608(-)